VKEWCRKVMCGISKVELGRGEVELRKAPFCPGDVLSSVVWER
jgi:hypothetical protein